MIYDLILADPPWNYRNWAADEPGQIHDRGRGANRHYPTMTTDQIAALPVPAADDALLFLWGTWPHLPDALRVVSAWGFQYSSLAWVWLKTKRRVSASQISMFAPVLDQIESMLHMGMGYRTRANTEYCLLATRGKVPRPADRGVLSVMVEPVGRHSAKPLRQYELINRLYPATMWGPRRLEMFARQAQPGWDVFGNEVSDSIDLLGTPP